MFIRLVSPPALTILVDHARFVIPGHTSRCKPYCIADGSRSFVQSASARVRWPDGHVEETLVHLRYALRTVRDFDSVLYKLDLLPEISVEIHGLSVPVPLSDLEVEVESLEFAS